MYANNRADSGVTSDLKVVARDLAEFGDMAATLEIDYDGLSWATQNTWSLSWKAVRFANRPGVGLIVDAFNVLAVEFADPHNPDMGTGRFYLNYLSCSMSYSAFANVSSPRTLSSVAAFPTPIASCEPQCFQLPF